MWFDGKTPEEINERLQKEGIFTKLITAARARRGEEPLTTEVDYDELASVAKHIFVPFVSGIRPPENIKKIKAFSVRSVRNKVGDAIIYLMEQAEKGIFVTHFFLEQYLPMYVEVQREKLREGVPIERIVEEHLEHSDEYKWLDDFQDEHGNPIGNYKEYTISSNRLFNFDFMIIDKKIVILVYRGSSYDDALIFENDSMVQIFLNFWNNLKPQEDGDGNTADLITTVTPTQRGRGIKNNSNVRRRRTKGNS